MAPNPKKRVGTHFIKTRMERIVYTAKIYGNPLNQSKLEVITRSRHKARENVHARDTVGFGFTSDWLKKWRENFEPVTE